MDFFKEYKKGKDDEVKKGLVMSKVITLKY